MPTKPLRPPGAVAEREFARLCVQCGQCAGVCSFRSIVLDAGVNLFGAGLPRVEPKRVPCWLCMRCGPACPTGALKVVDKHEAAMGTAVIDRERCYTYIGTILCRTCFERCPLKARAIELDEKLQPVITKQCVGCGVCEHVCPAHCIETFPTGTKPPEGEGNRSARESQERPGLLGFLARMFFA